MAAQDKEKTRIAIGEMANQSTGKAKSQFIANWLWRSVEILKTNSFSKTPAEDFEAL